MITVYFVTGNKGKLEEVRSLAKKYGIRVEQLNVEKMEIQSDDIKEIALFAARQVFSQVDRSRTVVVEDAGLFIEALKGFPGPYSSYVYKTIGVRGVLKLMEGIEDRRAYFRAVVVVESPEFGEKIFEGRVYGRIALKPKGTRGFGFDPIFIPDGYDKTFAEMDLEQKNKLSHRAKAFRSFFEWLRQRLSKT